MTIELTKIEGKQFAFEASNGVETIPICAADTLESGNHGFRPMQLLLSSLAGCMSIDIQLILKKQRQEVQLFSVQVAAERATAQPAVFTQIKMHFTLTGQVLPKKLEQAIRLSEEKYCSVYHSLHPNISIQSDYTIQPSI